MQMNNNFVGPIVPGRGLRQGDPTSPYLFILCTKGLSTAISWAYANSVIHENKIFRMATEVRFIFC